MERLPHMLTRERLPNVASIRYFPELIALSNVEGLELEVYRVLSWHIPLCVMHTRVADYFVHIWRVSEVLSL